MCYASLVYLIFEYSTLNFKYKMALQILSKDLLNTCYNINALTKNNYNHYKQLIKNNPSSKNIIFILNLAKTKNHMIKKIS